MINVTKTYLPPFDKYTELLKRAWNNVWITNNGELVQELEGKLKSYLHLDNLLFTNNGTIVLQFALKALDITKEVITTPFSYVATTNAILWENCKPVFVDIRTDTYCIDASKIEGAITKDTQAILATHVYGLPCDVEKIQQIADRYNLKVIYDGAHAFGCNYKQQSLLNYGDISTCSFHATKLFHTVEGGAIIANDKEIFNKIMLYRQFGHIGDMYYSGGINGKNSEMHAAMGLAVLPNITDIIKARKEIFESYNEKLNSIVKTINYTIPGFEYNYAYYPILFENEDSLLKVQHVLFENGVNTRRYFYPSLNTLPQTIHLQANCPVSENISSKILCLPLYHGLSAIDVENIADLIIKNI